MSALARQSSVCLIGFTVSEQQFSEATSRSTILITQTHNFAWNVVTALQSGGLGVQLLSALPVPNYPEYPAVLIPTTRIDAGQVTGISMGFVNIVVLKHLSRFVQCLIHAPKLIRDAKCDYLIVHGAHSPFLLFARIARGRKRKTLVILTDPPAVIRAVDGRMTRAMKRIDRALVRALCRGFDGVIALTPQLASEFAPGVRAFVTPGFAPARNPGQAPAKRGPEERIIAYAGGLSQEYGVRNLVSAFQMLDGVDLRLDLYGRGELERWAGERAVSDSRIRYHGALAPADLYPILRSADVLVNPRLVSNADSQYSFPSKIMEYMALGVPTVSTPVPGLAGEFAEHVVVSEGDSPEALARAISVVLRQSQSKRSRFGRDATAYLTRTKSPAAQGPRLAEFLEAL